MVAFPWHQVAIAALFVIAFYSVANFVLLNMLITIIMENFELKSEKKMHEDQICHFVRDYHFAGDHHYEQEELDKLENHLKKYLPSTELSSQDKECMESVESKYRYHLISSYEHSLLSESTLSTCTSDNHPTMSTYKPSEKPSSLSSFRNWCLIMVKPHRAKSKEVPINLNYNRVFDTIITLAIIASLVTAAITTPRWHFEQAKLDPNDQSNALTVLNIVFPAIFTIEFLIRVIAEGFRKFFSCNDGDASIVTLQDCMGTFADGNNVTMPRVWSNPGYNFDNFMSSILILFQLSSQEGWVGVMETARDIVGVGMQPISDASLYNSIYFVIFSYAGGLFVSSLFVAIVIENYTKRSGIALMTCDQKRWMGMKKLIESTHMSKSYEGELALEKKILWSSTKLKSGWFPLLFDVFTVIVAIALMSEYVHINNRQVIKNWMFMAIMILYMAENYIKIVGLG
ncbi:calcium channel protein, partial [Haplosporangium sp. Z 27]